ncbi:MAG: hypothetical protein JWM33_2329 [Caulobacteraceae bacterium]|nr:hypothetical protein [Caulobacteraceae bacterium]
MTNVSGAPTKLATRKGLFSFAERTLEKQGWRVSRIPRAGKGSMRLITRGSESHKVSIRTSQDTWIAFPPKATGKGWITLDDVDYVIAASVNDKHNPTEARVHMIPGDEARARFDRAYAARKAAHHTLPVGRGIWLSLYDKDAADPVSHVGGGMGLDFRPLDVFDLTKSSLSIDGEADDEAETNETTEAAPVRAIAETPLTIGEAKRRLAESLGVPEHSIKITIEH